MTTTTIQIKGLEYPTADEAIQGADAGGGEAITLGGKFLVVERPEADRIAAAGVSFAYLCVNVAADGAERVVTVPIN